ncbi:MAG: hypothetical protein P4N24_22010 [Acidobacteriota bacterium]|nr:hypothetical protein [Acidobacteriota bacterium]
MSLGHLLPQGRGWTAPRAFTSGRGTGEGFFDPASLAPERTANFIFRNLRQNLSHPWCQRMRKRFELPATVHHHAHYRVWNRRGYDMNIYRDKKQNEKIDYIHNNPVARGLVAHPGDWPWSSWRFYYREDRSLLAMDHMR